MIDLVARVAFTHDGVSYAKGEALSVPPIVAAALTYQRKAVFASQSRDLAVETPTRRRRTYRRRDLVAEPS